MPKTTLYYIADPMCSWCWGFAAVLEKAVALLPQGVPVRYVMGGLAPDSDVPMPEETREYIKEQWRLVAAHTGAEFDWDFWTECQPRRSTYPACRAVLAASAQDSDAGPAMFQRVQHAYYTEARNPSDADTLIALAVDLSLDTERFTHDLTAPETDALLQEEFTLRHRLGANRFPGLILDQGGARTRLADGHANEAAVLDALAAALNAS